MLMNPFRDIERLLSDAARPSGTFAMPMDVFRDGENFVVKVDLPGVAPESIDVDVEDRTLTIRAERRDEEQREGFEWLVRERPAGSVARQMTLGTSLATDRISASFEDGVLRVTIPVAEEAKPRKISIERGGSRTQLTS
ncbi:Hsp20/alpha crystallin family protein [Pseudoclavibacter endophyticus]|uniref:Hsp20/alpha crystallin family protein n=2 Tax=Pseudoclavibacter endophyticus TaxID=1778590 RepID=A0A6H9WHW0_9MICO|nr:Hsp20/alpha crystallin family protein [Pseudoclavibacter endophyticus]